MQHRLNSVDVVEVSVALGGALLLEREGIAPGSRPTLFVKVPPLGRGAVESHGEGKTTWDEGIAQQENQRRIAALSESLEASDVRHLQVLRRSLETQIHEATRAEETKERHKNRSRIPIDDASRWHTDLLELRLAAVSRAVDRKGGWRAAVFREDGAVDVDVDVEPWPEEDRVLMLQTVRDALNFKEMQVSYGALTLRDTGFIRGLKRGFPRATIMDHWYDLRFQMPGPS